MMRAHRIHRTILPALIVASAAVAFPVPGAAELPILVSPAADALEPAVVEPCPTLSWSGVSGARGYQVEILETGDGPERVVHRAEVGDARAWTPSACLAEGGAYAWRVRGLFSGATATPWSRPAPFRVAATESFEAALERVARRLAEEGRLSAQELDGLRQAGLFGAEDGAPVQVVPARPGAGALPAAPSPLHTTGDAAVHVGDSGGVGVVALGIDYGIYAEAFDPAGAVTGRATGSGQNRGVVGDNGNAIDGNAPAGTVAIGVRGTGRAVGVRGTSVAPLGRGVRGRDLLTAGFTQGVVGESAGIQGKGVEARATDVDGTSYGVRADATGGASDFYADGAGADYGPFTGSHLVRVAPGSPEIGPGMVVAVTGEVEALQNPDGSVHLAATLPTVRLATTPRDPAVLGAFTAEVVLDSGHPWATAGGGRIAAVNAVGEGRLWVTDTNGPVRAGDYLTTSSVPGHAARQDEPEQRAYTVAKVIETVDWSTARTVTVDGRSVRVALVAVVYTGG